LKGKKVEAIECNDVKILSAAKFPEAQECDATAAK